MTWKWTRKSHKEAAARAAHAAQLRRLAEQAEADAAERVRTPMRRLREQNHVVEDLLHLIRKAPG